MVGRTLLTPAALLALISSAVLGQPPASLLPGRWQYLQPPDTEGEILDLVVSADGWRGIMNGLERAGEHGLFYYVAEVEQLAVEPDGNLSFEVGSRSFFSQRPALSQLAGEGDSGFARARLSFAGRLEAGDLVLRCTDDDGSCPDSTLRFERITATPGSSQASVADPVGFHAWVGLYAPARLGWLENENRISELCGSSGEIDACYAKMLGPAIDVYGLYADPDESSVRVGDLVVAAVPGRGLSAHFRPSGGSETQPFVPDLFLQDWGYGTYFHQTIARQQGDWFQLPSGPWEEFVWLYRPDQRDQSLIIAVQAGDILEMGGRSMFVLAAEADALSLRDEQAADLWCEEGEPPPLVPDEPTRRSRVELLDGNGHLIIRPKYLKGC
jgi:hypothetical protein